MIVACEVTRWLWDGYVIAVQNYGKRICWTAQGWARRGLIRVSMGQVKVMGRLSTSTYIQTHHSSRDCFQWRQQLNAGGQVSGWGGMVHVLQAHFLGSAAQRVREEQTCSPTGTPRVLVGGCVMSGWFLLSLSWLNCLLGRKRMVKQARDMMCIFTSLKMASVPQLSHQIHIHCSVLEGHAVMSLPVFSPAMGNCHLIIQTSEGILPF